MITPTEYVGPLMELGQARRGILGEIKYLTPTRTTIIYDMPLVEVITDFFDQVKTRTKGYASMSFAEIGFKEDNLVRLDIRINGEDAPPLATIVHRDRAHDIGKGSVQEVERVYPSPTVQNSHSGLRGGQASGVGAYWGSYERCTREVLRW